MKRTQIQIAIDALKKQLEKYQQERVKAFNAASEALASQKFFDGEIDRLKNQIKQLEKPAEAVEHDKVLKALEG